MSEDAIIHFDQLDLKMGQVVQILQKNGDKTRAYDVVLMGVLPNEALIIAPSDDGPFPAIDEGQNLVLRVYSADGVALISTLALLIITDPMLMVFADYPQKVNFKQIRHAKRVEISMPCLATNTSAGTPRSLDGRFVDISTAGAGLEMSSQLGKAGDSIEIRGKFMVGNIQRMLSIHAVIRSHRPKGERHIYGVEFHEDNEEDLLVLFGFIFNAMAFGHIQKIR